MTHWAKRLPSHCRGEDGGETRTRGAEAQGNFPTTRGAACGGKSGGGTTPAVPREAGRPEGPGHVPHGRAPRRRRANASRVYRSLCEGVDAAEAEGDGASRCEALLQQMALRLRSGGWEDELDAAEHVAEHPREGAVTERHVACRPAKSKLLSLSE